MNYRHAFHAGNHADVLKHAVLSSALARMTAKPKPMSVIDVFAGAGGYDVALDERAARTGEWRGGAGKIWRWDDAPDPIAPYAALLEAMNAGPAAQGGLRFLPGSPLVALDALRADDKLLASELHPDEAAALARTLAGDRRARAVRQDAWSALASFLPPTPRRGLALIDPPFERPGELERMAAALVDGLRRWATGVWVLWRPVKDGAAEAAAGAAFEAAVGRAAKDAGAGQGEGRAALAMELQVAAPGSGGLIGSALAVVNPPFGLAEAWAEAGPRVAARLEERPGVGAWRQDWLSSPR